MSIAVLEIADIRKNVVSLTLADYHLLGETGQISEKTELIEGVIVEKMSKSPKHIYFQLKIIELFNRLLKNKYFIQSEGPISILNSEPEPDISIIKGAITDFKTSRPTTAEIVVEIAVTSLKLDREKARIYAAANVPEYLLINLNEMQIELYSQPDSTLQQYESKIILQENDLFQSTVLNEIQFRLADFN